MANDRMYIVCAECNQPIADAKDPKDFWDARFGLAKHSEGFWDGTRFTVEDFDMFLDRHRWCGDGSGTQFEIRYESLDPSLRIAPEGKGARESGPSSLT